MRIHRNLHNARAGGPQWVSTVRGRVDEYHEAVSLSDVRTRIQPGGRAKCERRQVRNVCAFFDGDSCRPRRVGQGWQRVSFDPRLNTEFLADGEPWNVADAAELRSDGSAWVLHPRLEGQA